MTTETNATVNLNEAAANLTLAKAAKNIFETTNETFTNRRRNFAIAAAAGAAIGVGVTALSERSTTTTLAGTAIFGGLLVAGVYNNSEIPLYDDNAATLGTVTGVVGVETALFGCVMNLLVGATPEADSE